MENLNESEERNYSPEIKASHKPKSKLELNKQIDEKKEHSNRRKFDLENKTFSRCRFDA